MFQAQWRVPEVSDPTKLTGQQLWKYHVCIAFASRQTEKKCIANQTYKTDTLWSAQAGFAVVVLRGKWSGKFQQKQLKSSI